MLWFAAIFLALATTLTKRPFKKILQKPTKPCYMKPFLKISGILLLMLVLSVSGLVAYVKMALPNIEVPQMTIKSNPELIERGRYLATHVMACMDCHSRRDFTKFSGPPLAGSWGAGGDRFGHEIGMPGDIYVPNITPAKGAEWTDGELYRAITSGVAPDGRALFNIMPYQAYGKADIKDIEAVMAYIRSLEPINNDVPKRNLDFPVNILVNTIPVAADHQSIPEKSDIVAYGRYMTTIAGCIDCHTPMSSPGKIDISKAFSGGFVFNMPDGSVIRSVNITPHATGLGNWSKEMFVSKFKAYDPAINPPKTVSAGEFNSIMPWTMYAGMTEEDLGAIYEYLRTITPMENSVERFTPLSEKKM